MPLSSADREALKKLLREYNEYPEQRERIVPEIERRFQRSLAILVVDSCGFSRTVRDAGIIHFLALLERLERLVAPIVERCSGRVLRLEADNIFAVFPDAMSAVRCAEEICREIAIANEPLPAADEIYVSIGVGYGQALVIGSDDLYGDEMNLTCKLGEDLAQRGEILVTSGAHDSLGASPWEFEEATFSISGLNLTAYRLVQQSAPSRTRDR